MSTESQIANALFYNNQGKELSKVAEKVYNEERITIEEGILLYEEGELAFVGALANNIRERIHNNNTFFNQNYHIEPTNICIFSCKFCSYARSISQKEDSWTLSEDEILNIVRNKKGRGFSEIHIVGGVHPKLTLDFFIKLLKGIKAIDPSLHIKALTAVEYDYMFKKAKVSIQDGLKILSEAGLGSIPGGGAEIFHHEVRNKICADKVDASGWLEIHESAHKIGIQSNATMLYGHIESYSHRIDHMDRLRELQDKTGNFNAFIPLKFRNSNNEMSATKEVSIVEDMKNYAVSRIFLDNFSHIKAYWPMIGRANTQLALSFGVDDIDGTIDDTTKIYSLAGAEELHPSMTSNQIMDLIKQGNRHPVERDSNYNIKKHHVDMF